MSELPAQATDKSWSKLLPECLELIERDGFRALEPFLAAHPAEAPELRAQVERLRRIGLVAEPRIEQQIPERLGGFRLVEKLGEGGMGLVYLAEELALGRRVALKMVRPEQLFFAGARERFRREIASVALLQHPGIVPVYAVGEDGGIPFFTMELLDGCTLADVLRKLRGRDPRQLRGADLAQAIASASRPNAAEAPLRSPIFEGSWIQACLQIAREVAEALDYAHGRGIVHRDVKPSNISITRSGRALLFDFGLARSSGTETLTRTGSQPGSLPYMSPEQVLGQVDVDARSDVYSLGVTLYELFTLAQAFPPSSSERVRRDILYGELPRLCERNAAIPWDVETVCSTAMAREPARRYASAADFARDLGNVLAHRPIEARRPGPLLRFVRWAQRHPKSSASLFAALPLALLSLGAFAWMQDANLQREKDLHGQAAEQARIAGAEKVKVLRLSDIQRLADLRDEAQQLWPATPARVAAYDSWIARTDALLGRLELHRTALAELRALPGAKQETQRWVLPSPEDQWQHDTLQQLIEELEATPALVAEIEKRREFARTVEEHSRGGEEARALWSAALRSIADPGECPLYRGMALQPQLGLLPIGRDPHSGLWEFAHLQTGAPARRRPDATLEITPGTGLVFVLVPAGSFLMGTDVDGGTLQLRREMPAHEVALDAFFLSKYVMTQGQWVAVTGTNPMATTGFSKNSPVHPVASLSWDRCRAVLDQLVLDFPTEAQWEYSCRAGTTTLYWSGDDKQSLIGAANLLDRSGAKGDRLTELAHEDWLDDGYPALSPVDALRANPWGFHDMTGNVTQWCRDRIGRYAKPARDGDGERMEFDDQRRARRGASFISLVEAARATHRLFEHPTDTSPAVGLRPARALER